ncbi:MAG: Bax inhibitor-1 family protein, partial [Betaproteobacteria bacterium]|nr:Bax inhibitor-1 family protein [Betaproteobacteria bacterium]
MSAVINVRAGMSSTRVSPEAARVLRNTYLLLAVSLLPTIGGAAIGIANPPTAVLGFWGTLIAFMVALVGLQAMIIRNRNSAAGIGWLFVFTGALGYFLGDILAVALSLKNGVELIGLAIGGTAALFLALAGYATVTTRNFATPGISKVLFIGMIMAFGMGILNVAFLNMPVIALSLSSLFMI